MAGFVAADPKERHCLACSAADQGTVAVLVVVEETDAAQVVGIAAVSDVAAAVAAADFASSTVENSAVAVVQALPGSETSTADLRIGRSVYCFPFADCRSKAADQAQSSPSQETADCSARQTAAFAAAVPMVVVLIQDEALAVCDFLDPAVEPRGLDSVETCQSLRPKVLHQVEARTS